MSSFSLRTFVLFGLLSVLFPVRALAQACVTCWNETCPELASYTPRCTSSAPNTPSGPGRLSISSNPSGLTVTVDGRRVGSTPLANLSLPAGTHSIQVENNCVSGSESVLLPAGESRSVTVSTRAKTARVKVVGSDGKAIDADASVDNVRMDVTTRSAALPVCAKLLAVRNRSDGRRWQTALSLSEGEDKVFRTNFPGTASASSGGSSSSSGGSGTSSGPVNSSALAQLMQECQGGKGASCYSLGEMFMDGKGVVADKAKAAAFFESGCEHSHAASCTALGRMYANGDGVSKDPDRASAIYERACSLGDRKACDAVRATQRGTFPVPQGPTQWHTHWMLGGGINTSVHPEPFQGFAAWMIDEPSSGITLFASAGYERVGVRHPDDGDAGWMQQVNVSPLNLYIGTGGWRFGAGFDLVFGFDQQGTTRVNATGLEIGGSVGGGFSTDIGPVHLLGLLRLKGARGPREEALFLDLAFGFKGI